MRFFFDNCISKNLTAAMKVLCAGYHHVEHLTDRFPADTLDEAWLPIVGADPGLIVISADPQITRGKKERAAWREAHVTAFFFAGGLADKTIWKQAAEVVGWWPRITLEAKTAPRGSGYLLPAKGMNAPFRRVY